MGEPLYLLLGLHHHQPVGNFDGVFSEAFAKCYRPVLDVLAKHPDIKASLHHSGPLLDWALEREPGYLEKVAELVKRGQLEIVGGGFYEPILTILKPADALGQIEMMQRFWQERTGKRPAGMWLAERVWEPSIAALMADAGMSYTILDDQHFRNAGVIADPLTDYYRTERAGKSVAIFPTDKMLRYLIPFREPREVVDHLLRLADRFPGHAITYGDDGEKFGMWPGTYKWVIEEGWLEKFFAGLSAHKDRIVTTTFSEFMRDRVPAGTVYLPTASYSEMLEWAMPAEAILRYEEAKKAMERAHVWDAAAPFFRGGYWDNFLTKYPESNLMHKRAIAVSNKIDLAAAAGNDVAGPRRALYRAQCNCAYWHGLFGGVYLNYLRHAVYANLIDADASVDRMTFGDAPFAELSVADIDACGLPEATLANQELAAIVKPSAGGSLIALDDRPRRFNLLNTLARRKEAYHVLPKGGSHEGEGEGGVPSIHDIGKNISDYAALLVYDRGPRYAFLDHAFSAEPDWAKLPDELAHEIPGMDVVRYRIAKEERTSGTAAVAMAGTMPLPGGALSIEKRIGLAHRGTLSVHYRLRRQKSGTLPAWFATEFNFTLLAGHDPDRFYRWAQGQEGVAPLDERRVLSGPAALELVDRAFGFRVLISAEAARWALAPVETVSQSEQGFDKLYQGSTVWIGWKPAWSRDGTSEFSVGIAIESL
jgi:4-alpha-glucanotransferase